MALLYAKWGLLDQNIRLDCAHEMTISNLKAKQMSQLISGTFWVLHHQCGKAFIFLLGVFHPVEMKLMVILEGNENAIIEHQYKVFVKSVSFPGLVMEARVLCIITKSIYKQHISHLSGHAVPMLLEHRINLQAQHTQATGDINYAKNDIAKGVLINISDQNAQYTIIKVFQKWFRVDNIDAMEWSHLTNFEDSNSCDHQDIAFSLARVLIIDKYGLTKAGAKSKDILKQARDILESQLYLYRAECPSTDKVSLIKCLMSCRKLLIFYL